MQKTMPLSFGKPLIKHISHCKKTLPIRKLMFVISSKAYLFYLQTYNFILISRGYVFHFRIIYTLLLDSNEFIPITNLNVDTPFFDLKTNYDTHLNKSA